MTSTISNQKETKKLELLEQIKLLENEGEDTEQEPPKIIEEDETIEAPKKVKRIVKPRTEKQIESLSKGRQKMAQNQEEKRKIKEQENIIHKQELEKKLIDKAIKVKKKQLKKLKYSTTLATKTRHQQQYKNQNKKNQK